VHPEAYGVAKKIVAACGRDVRALMGDSAALRRSTRASSWTSASACPRCATSSPSWKNPAATRAPASAPRPFAEGVDDIKDLKPGMLLEGTVTNVAAFGAFVDIGVHQDGLVHVSQLADRFVKDAHEVVKAGDVVKVRVVEVDIKRKRIGLTMRKDGGAERQPQGRNNNAKPQHGTPQRHQPRGGAAGGQGGQAQGALGAALAEALKRR